MEQTMKQSKKRMLGKTIMLIFAVMLVAAAVPLALAQEGDNGNVGAGFGLGANMNAGGGDVNAGVNASANANTGGNADTVPPRPPWGQLQEQRQQMAQTHREGVLNATAQRNQELAQLREDVRSRVQGLVNQTGGLWNITKEDRQQMVGEFKQRAQQVREQFQDTMTQVRQQFRQEQQNLKQLQGQYQDQRQSFIAARNQFSEQCHDSNTTNCRQEREQFNAASKTYMGNAAAQVLIIINSTKTSVQTNANIGNTTAAFVVAQLDADAQTITDAQANVAALSNSSDINATKAAAADLLAAWQHARVTIRLTEGLLEQSQYQEFINHLNMMDTRFKEAGDKLQSEGKNTTALDTALGAFEQNVTTVTADYLQARDAYVGAMINVTTDADAEALIHSTQQQLNIVRGEAQSIKDTLRDIVKAIRDQDPAVLSQVSAEIANDTQTNSGDDLAIQTGGAQ